MAIVVVAASLLIFVSSLYIWSSYGNISITSRCDDDAACFDTRSNHSWSWSKPSFKEIEMQMKQQRSWQSSSSSSCDGRGFYVYDLPSKFNKDLADHDCGAMMPNHGFCKYLTNGGLGPTAEDLGPGWHNTQQFTLEPIFHARALRHKCRVREWREAVLFYVPFYAGLDITRRRIKEDPSSVKDSLALELVTWLERQDPWQQNSGRDHVFVLGKMTWEFRRQEGGNYGNKFQELPEMQNPIKLLIERNPWEINDIGVPYPTFFHPRTDEDIVEWQHRVSGFSRKSVIGFAGAPRPESGESIRSVLIEQCTSAGAAECKFLDCRKEGGCYRAETIVGFFMESEFCLQPPGDTPTRKSFFDSLISGCIPVVFDPLTAYYQYPWHLPENGTKYSVFIDQEEVRNKSVNVVQALTKIPPKIREDMRRYIVYQVLPGLLYGDLQSEFLHFQDAFSITMNALFGRIISTFNTTGFVHW
ncbi:hypothetical protein OROMI_011845 [Orobanche minor]